MENKAIQAKGFNNYFEKNEKTSFKGTKDEASIEAFENVKLFPSLKTLSKSKVQDYIEADGRFNFNGAPDEIFIEAFKNVKLFPPSKSLSKSTVKAYNDDLNDFISFVYKKNSSLGKVNVIIIQEYHAYLASNFAKRSMERKLGILKRFVSFGYSANFYSSSMVEYVEKPPRSKFLTSDQVGTGKAERRKLDLEKALIIIDALEEVVKTPRKQRVVLITRNKLIGYILLTGGLRSRELINLRWTDIVKQRDREENRIFYSLDFIGKGKKPRRVPLGQKVIDGLIKYREALNTVYGNYSRDFNNDDRPIFISTSREVLSQLSYQALYKIIKDAVIIADSNPGVSPHWFRHTFVTQLLEQDVPLAIVKDLAGHSDIATTNLYLESMNDKTVNREYSKVDFGI
ncbi:tyrosine-type recombinase/integrase [Priestia aryabhattai]